MKTPTFATLVRCFALSVIFPCDICHAQQPEEKLGSVQVSFDLLVVQLPAATALPMIPELRDRKRAAKATERLVKMIADKKATLIGWPVLTTKSGQRAMVEQVDEFRYATEFDAPNHLTITEQYPDAAGTPGAPIVPVDPKEAPPETRKPARVTTTDSTSDGVPTSFETRNVGVTLEIEPVISQDGRTIDLNLVPQHVVFLGMKKIEVERKGSGKKTVVEQPQFAANKVTTSIVVQDGDYTLLGVFRVSEAPAQLELFVLHTQIDRTILVPGASREDGGIIR